VGPPPAPAPRAWSGAARLASRWGSGATRPRRNRNVPRKARKATSKPVPDLEGTLLGQIKEAGLPSPLRQSRLPWSHTKRLFKADFCWPDEKVVVEVQGGGWGGRHVSGSGFMGDRVKINLATLAGYRVLEVCAAHIRDGSAVSWITHALGLGQSEAGFLPPKKRKGRVSPSPRVAPSPSPPHRRQS
jgi:very-short-patch-repair endonuclease